MADVARIDGELAKLEAKIGSLEAQLDALKATQDGGDIVIHNHIRGAVAAGAADEVEDSQPTVVRTGNNNSGGGTPSSCRRCRSIQVGLTRWRSWSDVWRVER